MRFEGPLSSFGDWDTCWSLYAFPQEQLGRSVSRQFRRNPCAVGEIFTFHLIDREYRLRLNDDSPSDIVVTPVCPEILEKKFELSDFPTGKISLIHGLPLTWTPTQFRASWHALDLFVNACTDDCFSNIAENLEYAGIKEFVVWGLDCVPGKNILRLIQIFSRFLSVRLIGHSLGNIHGSLVSAVEPCNIVSVASHVESVAEAPRKIFDLPDSSRIPPEAIEIAQTYFVNPLLNPEAISAFAAVIPQINAPKLLIHGPPQSGKSTLAKWILATVANKRPSINIIEVHASALFSKYLGSSEKRLQKVFRKATIAAPSVVFIEGVHALCPSRVGNDDDGETGISDTYNRVLATLLMCLDGLDTRGNGVSVIATSMLPPAQLDPAATRPGRLETWISLS